MESEQNELPPRDSMDYDVVIVGAGLAGRFLLEAYRPRSSAPPAAASRRATWISS